MSDEPKFVKNPLVLIVQDEGGKTQTYIHPPSDFTHAHYGLMVCDLVRHIAKMFGQPEEKVWYWVDKERRNPTTAVRTIKSAFQ